MYTDTERNRFGHIRLRSGRPLCDAVPQVGRHPSMHRLDVLELDMLLADAVEHSKAAAEQHGHQVDADLIDEPSMRNCCPMSGPPITLTSLPAAAALACSRALWIPSVTTVYTRRQARPRADCE